MAQANPLNPQHLVIGKVTRPHGVRGELRMQLYTDHPEHLHELETVYVGTDVTDPNLEPLTLLSVRFHQGLALLTVEEASSREDANRLRDLLVMVTIEDAVPLEDGEFYLFQVLGLRVQTEDGYVLGTIRDVIETGANDVYVIDSPDHGEVLFPVIEDTVVSHNIAAGVVTVVIPDGLITEK